MTVSLLSSPGIASMVSLSVFFLLDEKPHLEHPCVERRTQPLSASWIHILGSTSGVLRLSFPSGQTELFPWAIPNLISAWKSDGGFHVPTWRGQLFKQTGIQGMLWRSVVDVGNLQHRSTLSKGEFPQACGWASFKQLEGPKSKN